MRNKRAVLCLITGVLSIGMLTSCAGGKNKTVENSGDENTVTIWTGRSETAIAGYNSVEDTPGFKEMEKQIGVNIEYICPTAGQESEQFNLMLASREFPDAVRYSWNKVPGGIEKLIKDGIIYKMDEAFLKENAPDYYQMLQDNEVYDKASKTDSGSYYQFAKVFDYKEGQNETLFTGGHFMRSDWLKELGLEAPETIDEWHTALTAFKEKKGAEAPYTGAGLPYGLEGAFGILGDFYHDGDVVKYGPYEDNYKDFLTTMNQWYSEGLIDQNLVGITSKQVSSKILNGKSGVSFGWMASDFGSWMHAATGSFDMVGVQIPVKNKGDISEYSFALAPVDASGAIINAKAKNPKLVAKVLNFGYSEAGHMLANFGIEGESYVMENGSPVYTDKVLNNPEGLSVALARDAYCEAPGGVYREDYRYIQQYYNLPQQKEAQKIWKNGNGVNHVMPELSYTEEEAAERSKIITEVKTYVDEMVSKFIMGVEPMSNYDEYRARLKSLGIEKAISITQAAYDRYNAR